MSLWTKDELMVSLICICMHRIGTWRIFGDEDSSDSLVEDVKLLAICHF